MKSDKTTIWDPLRRKEVALTPEEQVRQWFIGVLRDVLKVPMHLMNSEVELHYGTVGKTYRADIVVFDHDAKPLAIVECKRPDVKLTRSVIEQALRYDMVLGARWYFITNGTETRIAARDGDSLRFVAKAPTFMEMTSNTL